MFLQASVILLTGGVPDTPRLGADTHPPPGSGTHPRSRHPPWDQVHPQADTLPRTSYPLGPDTPPRPGTPPQDQVHTPGADPPLGPGTPPDSEHAGRYGQHPGGTHPTGMQSCFFCILQLNNLFARDLSS